MIKMEAQHEEPVQKPRNTAELLRWLVFEPMLLHEYSSTVKGWRARLQAMWLPMLWIAVGCFAFYLLCILLIAGLDLPGRFPSQFTAVVTKNWSGQFWADAQMYFEVSIIEFPKVLALGLAFSLPFGLRVGLAISLAFGLALGLTFGLAISLASGLMFGLAFGLTGGLMFGLAFGLTGGLAVGLVFGLMGGLMGGSVGGLSVGLAFGLGFFGIWSFFYCRYYFYLFYTLRGFFQKYSFEKNPHLRDGVIFFPLWGMERDFQKQAYEEPEKGRAFSRFLFKRRRFQKQLAWQVQLASIAGEWRKNRLHPAALKGFPQMDEAAVWHEDKYWFINLSRRAVPLPTSDWLPQIETARLRLLEFEQESNVRIRVDYFRKFSTELDALYDLALRQPRSWGQYFVKALELWKKSAADRLRDLELEAAAEEPIAANLYRGGEKLRPDDRALFLGRNDLRDAFKKRVVTAVQMPLFFVQGQRRVGKSSLIAFLPSILDRGFTVVAYDMQEQPGLSLPALLQKLLERVRSACTPELSRNIGTGSSGTTSVSADPEQSSGVQGAWLDAWQQFRHDLEAVADQHPAKIVLAIDEYEEFHRILQSDPAQGGALLSAMRAYSQSQNRVVFLFAGADYFSELKGPNWAEYFVQAERLFVDYLGHDDSLKLIRVVDLNYPTDLLERMYHETQGHPCLLQKICREVVTIVNKTGRTSRNVVEADYDEALRRAVLMPDDGVINIFWGQFCENRGLKPAVRQILNGEMPTDERALLVLEDHGFILRSGGEVRLRVPLFEQWLRRYQVM